MFYRRKLILAIIEKLGGGIEKIRFQKLLFLYAMNKAQPEYDFVPYKYGCYSFSAAADMATMVKKGIISESETTYNRTDKTDYFVQLKPTDQKILKDTLADYGRMNNSALIKYTYEKYPFYAIKSLIAHDVFPGKLYEKVDAAIPKAEETKLFTIGYEGVSLEKYLLKLVKSNIKLLVDVRRNPLSMKFGFSKTLLKRYCISLGIEYLHIPEVGIPSEKRQSLASQDDYDRLFVQYQKTTLMETIPSQLQILNLLAEYGRIALTCFEADPCQCHRLHLANAISEFPQFNYPVKHL